MRSIKNSNEPTGARTGPGADQCTYWAVTQAMRQVGTDCGPYFFNPASVRWYWGMYLPTPEAGENPLASSLRAADLSGLPPATVITAGFDPLRDEAELYADKLSRAGVPVEVYRYDGVMHGFFTMLGTLDAARSAMLTAAARLRAAFSLEPSAQSPATGSQQ